ncbi:P-loop containing nucleoside triphosphate hydrolases superfamily protein [Hibiscus syriacus]|uniref:P-loop containing nucleoside triphosphate hydrolases superfamily protein n=1 Tax=Hibiscus syriacus TaxID=106335 RepID=A0A6A3CHA1_HIBSY|nr:non-specific lipid transfer protein GPI-anchored 25 [Hibiscus syriacus]KAE8728157.1 P-loop containing nucleoside triphosphate hydrolases superfamily protein [Hibiscus syriacus]
MATNIFILLLHLLLLGATAQLLPPAPQQSDCVEDLVAFSPCLPFVSDPPNNATDSVAPQCCDVFASAFESGEGYCFCYILRQPLIFGFPLNKERVASLSSSCVAKNGVTSLDSLCSSVVPSLPPLPSTTDSEISKPSNSHNSQSNSTNSPLEPAVRSPTPPSSPVEQTVFSSATNQIYKHITWFLLGMISFLLKPQSLLV